MRGVRPEEAADHAEGLEGAGVEQGQQEAAPQGVQDRFAPHPGELPGEGTLADLQVDGAPQHGVGAGAEDGVEGQPPAGPGE
jgi:hypothetical protein